MFRMMWQCTAANLLIAICWSSGSQRVQSLHVAKKSQRASATAVEGLAEFGLQPIQAGVPLPPPMPLDQLRKALEARRLATNMTAQRPWQPSDYFHPVDPTDQAQADAAKWAEEMLSTTSTTTPPRTTAPAAPVFHTEAPEEMIPAYLRTSITTSTPMPSIGTTQKVALDSSDTFSNEPDPAAAPAASRTGPRLGPPPPPACPKMPPYLEDEAVKAVLGKTESAPAPAPAAEAIDIGKPPVALNDGGAAWPLPDGGWAFKYPTVAIHVTKDGTARMAWAPTNKTGGLAYSMEVAEGKTSYHVGSSVIHAEANGDLVYQAPTGTMHREGSVLVYHWCHPNLVVYQTPAGVVYYDDQGITYQGLSGTSHFSSYGDVLYQGVGGVSHRLADGSVIHWTEAGAVYSNATGELSYTPVGEAQARPLLARDLGPDPFPGRPLTAKDVMAMVEGSWKPPQMPAFRKPGFSNVPSPAPAPAAAPSPSPGFGGAGFPPAPGPAQPMFGLR